MPEVCYTLFQASTGRFLFNVPQSQLTRVPPQWHECTQEGCEERFKHASNLKQHLAYVHDIDVQLLCEDTAEKAHMKRMRTSRWPGRGR